MEILIYFLIFIFGLIVGSFLNCVIYRLEKNESFLKGRSYCPKCKHTLSWWDLIPIFSFLILKGKCRYCSKKISLQYPLVEIVTGLLFLLIFNFQFPPIVESFAFTTGQAIFNLVDLCFMLYVSCSLIVIFVYDLKHYIIPDKVIYPAITITFIYRFFEFWSLNHWDLFRNLKLEIGNLEPLTLTILSAIGAASLFLLIVLVSRGKWMGVGDIKLAFFMGLFLGFPKILVALFSAFFIGAIIGIGLIATGKKTLKSEVPFGPFLVTGTFLALFLGEQIVNWYSSLFLL